MKIFFAILSIIIIAFTCESSAIAVCPIDNCDNNVVTTRKKCNPVYKDKCSLYNALNLDCKQVKYKEELEKEKLEKISQELPSLYKAENELKTLKCLNTNKQQISKQERKVKKIEKKIEKIEKCYDKKFYCKLSSLQKAKYRDITRLQKKEIKKCKKNKCQKLPKGMQPFAPGFGTEQSIK